jgi:multiple sugar transport system substrate-binding protein
MQLSGKTRRIFGVVLIVIPMLGFQACKRAETKADSSAKTIGPVIITFVNWASVEEATQGNIIAIIDAFQAANPDITINNQGIGVSDIVKELTIMCAAGNAPDVAQLTSDNVIQLQSAGFLTGMDSLLSPSFVSDLYPDLYDSVGLVDGKHYAVPWANTTHGLFYNKNLMVQAGLDPSSPPKTIDEFTRMMQTAKQKLPKDVIILQSDTTVRTLGLIHNWPLMLSFNDGVPPYTLDGKVNYNTPGMKAYMEWMRMLVNEGMTLPGMRYGQFRPYAAQNKLLFGNDWTCFDGIVRSLDVSKTLTPELMYETWGATALPASKNGIPSVPVQAHTLVMFENSKNKEATAKFIEFVVSDQLSVEEYIGKNGFTPVTKSAFSKVPSLEKSEFISSFVKDVVPASVTMPTGPDYASYAEVIMTGVQDVITSNRSIDDILAEGQKKLEDLFKK